MPLNSITSHSWYYKRQKMEFPFFALILLSFHYPSWEMGDKNLRELKRRQFEGRSEKCISNEIKIEKLLWKIYKFIKKKKIIIYKISLNLSKNKYLR